MILAEKSDKPSISSEEREELLEKLKTSEDEAKELKEKVRWGGLTSCVVDLNLLRVFFVLLKHRFDAIVVQLWQSARKIQAVLNIF